MERHDEEITGAVQAASVEVSLAMKAEQKATEEARQHYLTSDTFHPEHSCIRWLTSFITTDPAYKEKGGIYQRQSLSHGIANATKYAIGDLLYHQGGIAFELFWHREGRDDVSLGKIAFGKHL